jgi:LacI family transcriptional regulator
MPARRVSHRTENRRPSAFDVAREAGVSQTTVSFVLNDASGQSISEATKTRVLDAVKKLGYRPNSLARSLAFGKSNTIGMLVPYMDPGFHQSVIEGVQNTLEANGYGTLFAFSGRSAVREATQADFLLHHRVDALVCFGPGKVKGLISQWLDAADSARTPTIVIDDATYASRVDCVVSDDIAGVGIAMQHLYDLGHRRIALIAAPWLNSTAADRVAGYHAFIESHTLEYVNVITVADEHSGDRVAEIMRDLSTGKSAPTAYIAVNDGMFESVLRPQYGQWQSGARDLSLIGYGDTYVASAFRLTTVGQRPMEMGRIAAERLLERLNNPRLPYEALLVPTELILRDTTAPPAA